MRVICERISLFVIAIGFVLGSLWCEAASEKTAVNEYEIVLIQDSKIPLSAETKILQPKASGSIVYTAGESSIDASNAAEGYVMIKYYGKSNKAKVRISREGSTKYTYNLRADGEFEVFPLPSGNGNYQITVFYQVSGDQYAQAQAQSIKVELRNSLLPFLYPNQFVNFNAGSKIVSKSNALVKDLDSDLEIIASVYDYVIQNISYDNDKARLVSENKLSGYLPNVDSILEAKKGICFDYAALMSAMLRSQQIPARMELGYVSGGLYHAWISTYVKEIGWINGAIHFDGKNWKLMDPTFASNGAGSKEIMQFVGDGDNYQTVYVY